MLGQVVTDTRKIGATVFICRSFHGLLNHA
ncbi:hypothetical protein GGD56_002220 [Rhizobium mongolense]|uniref:Uncharacterized protein n=1 Tax=Rhizobium mongolense TaxID=57676 RepID=A0ABR6ILF2_9HYPH|nr:hypothetical protein [Rhizobium mongolense]